MFTQINYYTFINYYTENKIFFGSRNYLISISLCLSLKANLFSLILVKSSSEISVF